MADQSRSSIKESFPSEKKAQRGIRTTLCLVNRIRKMVCFKLDKEIEKDGFRLVTSVVQRKNFPLFLMRNRTSDLWNPRSDALPLSHGDSMVNKAHYRYYNIMTRVLHTARIRNVDSVMFCK